MTKSWKRSSSKAQSASRRENSYRTSSSCSIAKITRQLKEDKTEMSEAIKNMHEDLRKLRLELKKQAGDFNVSLAHAGQVRLRLDPNERNGS